MNENETQNTNTVAQVEQSTVVSQVISEPKLWAGKYKTPEDLEKAYGHSVHAIVEKAKLEKELDKYKVPESYQLPEGLSLREEDAKEIQEIAKRANLSQEQYDLLSKEMDSRVISNVERDQKYMEERKTQIGKERLTLLEDYVSKNYPTSVQDVVLNKLMRDDIAMNDALKDRDQRMNSTVPGIGKGSGHVDSYDGQTELRKAAEAWNKEPHNMKLREKYVSLARDVGHAREDLTRRG